jgi:hypothetical protein
MAMKNEEVPGVSEEKRISAELNAMIRLHKLSTLSVTEGDLERILCEIVDTAIALTGADFGNIQLVDPVSLALRIVAQRGFPQSWVDFWNNLPEGQGSCGVALKQGERVIVENVEQTPIFVGATLEMLLKASVRAVQSTPLVSRSGKPLGIFSTHYREPHRPDEDTLRLLDLLARQAADIIEHVQGIAMLRESEERLRLAMSSGTVGNWDWDVIKGGLHGLRNSVRSTEWRLGPHELTKTLVHGCIRTISLRRNPSEMPLSATTNSSTLTSESFVHPARFDGSLAGGRDITTRTAASCVWSGTILTLPSA